MKVCLSRWVGSIRTTHWFLIAVVFGVVVHTVIGVWRFNGLEPRMDQAFLMVWVRNILSADHILPVGNATEGFLARLEADPHSLIHSALKPLAIAPTTVFVLTGLVWFLLGGVAIGYSSSIQIGFSVFAQALALGLLALLPFSAMQSRHLNQREAISMGGIAFILAAISSFLHVFAPLGVHNVGLLTLVLTTIVFSRYMECLRKEAGGIRTLRLLAVAMQTLSCYANQANVFLLPLAALVTLCVSAPLSRRVRVAEMARYFVLSVIGALPATTVVLVSAMYVSNQNDQQSVTWLFQWVFAKAGPDLSTYFTNNFFHWWQTLFDTFSPFGTIAGVAGLFVYSKRTGQWLLFVLLMTHLAVWTLIGGFGAEYGQYTRTVAYALPFVALGAAVWPAIAIAHYPWSGEPRIHKVFISMGVLAVMAHIVLDTSRLAAPTSVKGWGGYYRSQGAWLSASETISTSLPPSSTIFPWAQDSAYILKALAKPKNGHLEFGPLVSTLDNLAMEGNTERYLERRGYRLADGAKAYLLLTGNAPTEDVDALAARTLCQPRLLHCHSAKSNMIESWTSQSASGQPIRLYKIQPIID